MEVLTSPTSTKGKGKKGKRCFLLDDVVGPTSLRQDSGVSVFSDALSALWFRRIGNVLQSLKV